MIIKGEMSVRVVFSSHTLIIYLTGLLRRTKHMMRTWRMSNGNRHGDE